MPFLQGINNIFAPQIITLIAVVIVALVALLIIFYLRAFQKFKSNEYVIHFRRGKVIRSGSGGSIIKLPIFDEVVVIPTTVQQTLLEAREQVVSYEYQDVAITAYIYWRVTDPEVSFAKVSWDPSAPDYVEKVLKNATESIIRTTCANMHIEQIIRDRSEIIKRVTAELHQLVGDWGVSVESVEIRDVEVLDRSLKENLEAIKKIEEAKKAKLSQAQMQEETRTRDLQVLEKTGLQEQEVKLKIETSAKQREIQVQKLEQERALIEADTRRKQVQIQAEAEKFRRVKQEIEVEVEKMIKEAEARKIQLMAEAEGEAEKIRQKLIAEAEGILQQVKALQQADERFIQIKTLEVLPQIFSNIKVDQMMLLGEGQDAYKAIAQMVLPFVQIAQQMGYIKPKKESSKSK